MLLQFFEVGLRGNDGDDRAKCNDNAFTGGDLGRSGGPHSLLLFYEAMTIAQRYSLFTHTDYMTRTTVTHRRG